MSWPSRRIDRVFDLMEREGVDALVFFSPENIYYLSGFGGEGVLVFGAGEGHLISDGRYHTQAQEESSEFSFRLSRGWLKGAGEVIRERGFRRVGFEAEAIPYRGYRQLKDAISETELVPLQDEVGRIRMVKEPDEVGHIREAIGIAEKAFGEIRPRVLSGSRERDLAVEFECFARRFGSDILPFDPIVASGRRSALPHARSTEKMLGEGELVIIDFGARAKGYASDQTRTFYLGNGRKKKQETDLYRVVHEAQQEAIAAVRPGIEAREIDRAARRSIVKSGWGDYFLHSTGHGVGLAVHEAPTISEDSRVVLEPGMVFTVEPGVYLPGVGGVRIEDMVMVTEKGARVLTTAA